MEPTNTIQTGQSIRTRLLALILGLVILSIIVIAFTSVSSILRAGQNAQAASDAILRQQATDYLTQITLGNAQTTAIALEKLRQDVDHIAQFAAQIYSAPADFATQTFWRADENMSLGPNNQYINGETDITSVFVPNTSVINNSLQTNIELSAYLDTLIPAIYDSNPNTVAIYLVHKDEITRLYPNINLGFIVPPDYKATEDIFFTVGNPANNPERQVVWTPIYEDPAGQGLLVTAVAPIYTTQNEFVGIIGIDLSLNDLTAAIEDTAPIAGGYSFLIDETGMSIALPAQGYQDILGTALPDGVSGTGADLGNVSSAFAPVLANMRNGETGFQAVNVSRRELFVSYTPLSGTNWSIANVVAAENMLQAAAVLQTEIQTSTQSLIASRILPTSVAILILAVIIGLLAANRLLAPIQNLAAAAQQIGAGNWQQTASIAPEAKRADEIGVLAKAFTSMIDQLKELINSLEQGVKERTQALETSVEVSRSLSTILDPDQLLREVVYQVRDAFNYYHAHIYLLDETTQQLRMAGGTGAAGQTMLDAGHALALGQGLVGRAAATNTAVLVPDVTQEPQWLPNPLLPDTKAETAVPISIGDKLLGVLDVQHNVTNGLNEENVTLLQAIADQVAIALQNARQLTQTETAQERFALAVAGTNDGIWDWDIRTNQVYFSPRWKEMIGYTDHEIRDDFAEFENHLHPDDHDYVMQQVDDYLNGRIPAFEFEFRFQHKNGSYRWILVRAALVRDEQGNPLRMAGSHTDITERKETEERNRERETLLRTIIDSTPDWIFVKDLDHRYVLVNQGYANSFHIPPDAFIGKNDLDIGFPAEIVQGNPEKGIRGFWADDREIMNRGQMKIIDEEPAVVDGKARILNTIKAPLQDDEGNVTGIVGFVHDITDLKHAEEMIRQEQARTQTLLESVTVPLLITRVQDGRYIFANQNAADMVGLPLADLHQLQTADFYADPAARQELLHLLQTEGYVNNYELQLRRANGTLFWGLISSRIFNFQGEMAIVSSIIDITARREAETALAQRAHTLQTVAQVGTAAATILEPNRLLQEVVDLTESQFNLYHAHIYLLKEESSALVLAAGANEPGRIMVARGHQIPLAQEQSLVARAARTHTGVVINDVQAEPGFLPNSLLPETRSEMAVPIIAGRELLGVLDVQAAEVERFTADDINIFTTLAAQIAVALQNAQRYAAAQRALDDLTRLQRSMAHEGWQAFLLSKERTLRGFHFDHNQAQPIYEADDIADLRADTPSAISLPLSIRGETIGQLGLRDPSGAPISPQKQALLQTMMLQVAEALERARLSEQTQLALTEAETLAQLGARLSAAQDYQGINTAVCDIIETRTNATLGSALFEIERDATGQPEWLVMVGSQDLTGNAMMFQRLPVSFTGQAPLWLTTEGRAVLIADTDQDPRLNSDERAIYQQTETHAIVFLPLKLGGNWIGLFVLSWREPVSFTPADERLFTAIIDQVALAMNSIQLLNAAQTRAHQEQTLREITTRVSTAVDADAILRTAAQEIGRAFGLETFVFLADTADLPTEITHTNGN